LEKVCWVKTSQRGKGGGRGQPGASFEKPKSTARKLEKGNGEERITQKTVTQLGVKGGREFKKEGKKKG